MRKEIKEYSDALEAHMEAKRQEVASRTLVNKTHYQLLKAREALRNVESDILTDLERSS